MNDTTVHRPDIDTDRCVCGGIVVFFEDGDADGEIGEGCEVADRVWPTKCAICGEPITGDDRARCMTPAPILS
jgi:hypothetical protein